MSFLLIYEFFSKTQVLNCSLPRTEIFCPRKLKLPVGENFYGTDFRNVKKF